MVTLDDALIVGDIDAVVDTVEVADSVAVEDCVGEEVTVCDCDGVLEDVWVDV